MKKKAQYKKKPTKAIPIGGIAAAFIAVGGATYYFARGGKFPAPPEPVKTSRNFN